MTDNHEPDKSIWKAVLAFITKLTPRQCLLALLSAIVLFFVYSLVVPYFAKEEHPHSTVANSTTVILPGSIVNPHSNVDPQLETSRTQDSQLTVEPIVKGELGPHQLTAALPIAASDDFEL